MAKFGTSVLDEEYFQLGPPKYKHPKIRGSLLLTTDFGFLQNNIKAIEKIEVIDVLGCRYGYAENSSKFENFNEASFSIAREGYGDFLNSIRDLTNSLHVLDVKTIISKFLDFGSTYDEEMWFKVPTFVQICITGLTTIHAESTQVIIPNTYKGLFKNAICEVNYYNPRGGVERAIEKYL